MRCGALDGRIALCVGRGHLRVALDAGDVGPAHVGDVVVLVAHFLDGERNHLEAHLAHVFGAGGAHPFAHHLRLLDDLLHRQLADDAAQMALHHQADQPFAQLRRLGEELLGSGQDRGLVAAHLDLCYRLHCDSHALFGIEVLLRSHVETHQLQAQLAAVLHHGKDHRSVALDDPWPAEAVDNQSLIRASLAIHPSQDAHEENQRQDPESHNDNNLIRHCVPGPLNREEMGRWFYCFERLLRPFLGKSLARNPSKKIPTRMAMSVINTVVFVIQVPVPSTGKGLVNGADSCLLQRGVLILRTCSPVHDSLPSVRSSHRRT